MHNRIIHALIACIAACSFAALATANDIEVRLIGIETSRNDLYIKQDADFVKVTVPLYTSSAYFKTQTVEGSLQLFTREDTPEGPVYEVLVQAELSNDIQSALAVYLLAPDGQPQIHVYNDDWSAFPAQSYRVINISPVTISSKIEDHLIQVAPFQAETVEINIESNLPLVRIMTVYKGGDQEWKPIFNRRTPLLPDWRITGIAVVTHGKLSEAMGSPQIENQTPQPDKAKLSFFSFNDSSSTSAQKVAERQKPAQ